jgi:hypothetical protein
MEDLSGAPHSMIDEVRARRAGFEASGSRPWPDIIRDGHEVYAEAAVPAEAADGELCGVAGSPGVVTGVARVFRWPEGVGKLRNNDILVAPLTKPVWTTPVRHRWRGDHRARRHPVPRGHRGPGIGHPGGPVGCRRDKTRARRTKRSPWTGTGRSCCWRQEGPRVDRSGGYGLPAGVGPVAWIIARVVTGQDLGQLGSGNVRAMNTALSVARWAGMLVFLPEAGKGVLAVALARTLDGGEASALVDREVAAALTMLATLAGTRLSNLWAFLSGPRRHRNPVFYPGNPADYLLQSE